MKRRFLIADNEKSSYTYDELSESAKENAIDNVADILNEQNVEELLQSDLASINIDLNKLGLSDDEFDIHIGDDNPFDFVIDLHTNIDANSDLFKQAEKEAEIDLSDYYKDSEEKPYSMSDEEIKEFTDGMTDDDADAWLEDKPLSFSVSGKIKDYRDSELTIKTSNVPIGSFSYKFDELMERLEDGITTVLERIVAKYKEGSDQDLMDMDMEGREQAENEVSDYKFDADGNIIKNK